MRLALLDRFGVLVLVLVVLDDDDHPLAAAGRRFHLDVEVEIGRASCRERV